MKNYNKKGYSVIISIILIGLLLMISTGILNVVMKELKDNRGLGNSIKAYAGAESAQELALLNIKNNGYGFYYKIDSDINDESVILSNNVLDKSKFNKSEDVFISYDLDSKTDKYVGTIDSLSYDIIPLFYFNGLGEQKVNKIEITKLYGNENDLAWNVIGKDSGISGKGFNLDGIKKETVGLDLKVVETDVNSFLQTSDLNYLVLFNSGNSNQIKYQIKALIDGEEFTKPKINIVSSAQIGNYKQNLSTKMNNSEYLNLLKYSIYSN